MFETEVATYEAKKAELLEREGDYVVIQGHQLIGIFKSLDEAYSSGIDRCGSDPFFIHRISKVEPVAMISPLMSMPKPEAEAESTVTYVPT